MLRTESVPKSIPTTRLSASLTTSPPREWLADPDGLESLATVNVPPAQSQAADQAGSGGSRDGREQLAFPAEFVGEIERRVAVAQQADVPYGEQALGLRHAQLLEREGEPDALQDRDRRGELGEQRLRERQDVFLLPYERLQPAAKDGAIERPSLLLLCDDRPVGSHLLLERRLPWRFLVKGEEPLLEVRIREPGERAAGSEPRLVPVEEQLRGRSDQDAVQVVLLRARRTGGFPEMCDGVLGGGRRTRASEGLHREPGNEGGLGERAHRCRRVATPRARGVDRLSRRSQGETAHAIAMCLTGNALRDAPVEAGEILGEQIAKPRKKEAARRPREDVEVADDDLGWSGRDGAMVTGDANRRRRRAVGVHRGGGRDAPVGKGCIERHLLYQVAHDPAADADQQIRCEGPHLRRQRRGEIERRNGKWLAGQDPRGNARCVDGPLPALPRGRLGALVAQHPERDRAAVPPQERARG